MNWLQRNLPSRESWKWVIATFVMVLTYVSAHFQAFQIAFDLAPKTEQRIELFAGLLGMLLAKQTFSWMPSKEKQAQVNLKREFDHNLEREIEEVDRKP